MATVCGSSLSMMDGGVPLKAPVAGVAMGLILEGEKFAVLTDILGDEDHLGDMDFKVAGTANGITSLQMDIKVAGITPAIMEQALAQAKDGRMHILGEMAKALTAGRTEFSAHAPRIETMQIAVDKIREVIGSGGKVIRSIVEESGAKVDINDDGTIKIASANAAAIEKARELIGAIVDEPEVGRIYTGKVVKIMDFGAFVNFFGKRDGLVHVSQLSSERVGHPKDLLQEGQSVKVKLMGFDERGKVRLSMKAVDQETGKEKVAGERDGGVGAAPLPTREGPARAGPLSLVERRSGHNKPLGRAYRHNNAACCAWIGISNTSSLPAVLRPAGILSEPEGGLTAPAGAPARSTRRQNRSSRRGRGPRTKPRGSPSSAPRRSGSPAARCSRCPRPHRHRDSRPSAPRAGPDRCRWRSPHSDRRCIAGKRPRAARRGPPRGRAPPP